MKDMVTGIQHIGIPTNDIEKTIEFYQSLGFETILRTQNDGEKVAFLQLADLVVETYENGRAVGRPGAIDHVALNVTNIENAYQKIKLCGHDIIEDSIQFLPFWEKGVRFFTIAGVNGEKIEFSQKL